MATTKVGIYRSYRGPVPVGPDGSALPKSEWARKRPFSWVVRWYGSDGNRYSKSFESRKEADRFSESRQPDVPKGHGDPPKAARSAFFIVSTFRSPRDPWHARRCWGQTSALRQLASRVGWDRDLRKITSRDIEGFRAWRSECPNVESAATVNKDVKILKRLFNLAASRGYLARGHNPCVGVTLLKVGEKRPPCMSPAKFELLYGEARRLIDRAMLVVLYVTGIRRGEASHLLWDDVDFERSIVHVARHGAGRYVQKWTPKDHERREVPLPAKAVELLRSWKEQAPADCPYVFMDAARWEAYRDCVDRREWPADRELVNNLLRKFETMVRRAGIGTYTLHDLRRSCITNWARKGLPIHVAQKLAGHAEIKTTQKFYLSVQDEDLEAARSAQQEIVGGLKSVEPRGATDHLLTILPKNPGCLKRKLFTPGTQLPPEAEVA